MHDKLFSKSLNLFQESNLEDLLKKIKEYEVIIVTADKLAMKLMYELRQIDENLEYGIKIFSFDNISFTKYMKPKINTVDLFQTKKGENAISSLISYLKSENKPQKRIINDSEIIISNL